MTPEERDTVVSFAQAHQTKGDVLAWSIDEDENVAEFFVPLDADATDLPMRIGPVRVMLTWMPRAKEMR
jgi:hypothetical protein